MNEESGADAWWIKAVADRVGSACALPPSSAGLWVYRSFTVSGPFSFVSIEFASRLLIGIVRGSSVPGSPARRGEHLAGVGFVPASRRRLDDDVE
jgi:hypothetical protein